MLNHALVAIIVAYFSALGVSIVLAPLLCNWVTTLATFHPNAAWIGWLAHYPVHVWTDRIQLVLIILLLFYVIKKYTLSIKIFDANGVRDGGLGWAFGILFSAILVGCAYYDGFLRFKSGVEGVLSFVVVKFLSAWLLAFFEEWIFRGVILQACLRFFHRRGVAVIVCSALFAFAHIRWRTVEVLPWGYLSMLFCLGIFLCLQTLRTRNLMFAVGFHAAIVGWLFVQRAYVMQVGVVKNVWLWGDGLLQHAPLTSLLLLSLCWFSRQIQHD